MVDLKSITALIKLIDDPDDSIYAHVHDRLLSYGPEAIPYLETSWEGEDYGLLFQSRIENLIHEIQFENCKNNLKEWINSNDKNLLEGAIIIAQYQYPGLDVNEILGDLAEIQHDIWLEINPKLTALEKVQIFNSIFFGKHNFQGNSKNFHSPMNSYINTVLESRKGNPLSLCIVYSIIAQNLGLPIYGINLPNHFILAYLDEHGIQRFLPEKNEHGILFYINAFSKGSLLNEKEIKAFLDKIKFPHNKDFFEPCSNSAILIRMLTNLISSFQDVGNSLKVNELTELRELFFEGTSSNENEEDEEENED
jgi:regulator of sirC expression with transglutaminase-like and TPR domain